MDVLGPLFQLLFRSLVTLIPLTVGWLAFRRLALSRTGNAWIYAATCLFATVTTAGLLPWTLGLARVGWLFLVLAAFCPAIWIGVIGVCDMSRRKDHYGPDPLMDKVLKFKARPQRKPLVLENPDWPGTPMPIFRHSRPDTGHNALEKASPTPRLTDKKPTPRTLMTIAREMRGNNTSDARRPKLLPPPELASLPFIRG